MAKIQSLEFAALTVKGDNYLQWALDIKISLKSKGLGECIVEGNEVDETERFKAILLIRHHLNESLKNQYMTIEDPFELWSELKKRYDHQKTVSLPKAEFDWKNLRFQDFKSVDEYNSELFKIVSTLKLCEKEVTETELIDKTLSTFHTSNVLLQQQYRERQFKTYAELISCLLLAEQNNELLLMNSQMRPPGAAPIPEAHKADTTKEPNGPKETNYVQRHKDRGQGNHNGSGRGRGSGRGHGRGNNYSQGQGSRQGGRDRRNYSYGRGRGISKPEWAKNMPCHKCGMNNHWANQCRTPKHLVELYQKSQKGKPETNMVHLDKEEDFDHEEDETMGYETSDCLKN